MPIQGIHAALQSCEEAAAPEPHVVLPQVIEQIDAAAGLVRQLKMSAYRGAPQAAVVGLHEAVRGAWAGVVQWRRGPALEMAIAGALGVEVRADRQRLSVLLCILLMEAERAGSGGVRQVGLERGQGSGRLALSSPGLPRPGAGPARSIGLALCREIVQEMGGELAFGKPSSEQPGFLLQLPSS